MSANNGTADNNSLSPDQAENNDRQHVINLLKPGAEHTLNLADEAQYRFLMSNLSRTGRTPQTSPELFRSLARTRERHIQNGGPQSTPPAGPTEPERITAITGLDTTDHINYIASGLSSVPGGCYYTGLSLQLFDAETGKSIGEPAVVDVYGSGEYVPIQATGQTEAGRAVRADLTLTYAPPGVHPTDDEVQNTVQSVTVSNLPKTPPKSTAPVRKTGHITSYVLVCLLRSAGNDADCDYGPYGNKIVQLPVSGSITYNNNILPLTLENAYAQLYIVSRNSGGGTKYFLPGQPITTNFSISSTDPTLLTWNFNLANFGISNPFANYSYVDIVLEFAVTTEGNPNQIPAWVTSAADAVPGPNLEKILPLQFADGCIAEGTLITLADGTTRPIEQFEGGETILADKNGTRLTVRFTNSGVEHDLMVLLKDDSGRSLKVTQNHAVLTDKGPRLAHLLKEGDLLLTATGPAAIVEIERVAFAGRVWNLTIGMGEDEMSKLDDENRTFFANGFLVGDSAMQAIHLKAHRQKREHVLTSLPERWHQDFLNSLRQA